MIKWGLMVLVFSVGAAADVHKIAKDLQSAKDNLEIQEFKQRKVLAALYGINKNLKKLVTENSALLQQKDITQLQIQELTKKIEDNAQKAEQQREQLAVRTRAIYKLKGPTLARFLFAARSSSDLERNLKVLGLVAKRDMELIKSYRDSVSDLHYRKERMQQKLSSLREVEDTFRNHEQKLKKELTQKNSILAGIRRRKMFTQDKINELRSKSHQDDLADTGIMDLLLRPSFAEQKGQLPRPVQGPVVKGFGLSKAPDQSYVLSHKGLFIEAAPGSLVRATFGGVVSFAGSLPGLGQVLILDHGDHYYTVYGNNANLRVQLGQEVKQAQVIASSGHSGFDRKHGLYFEVRHFSEPYNPMEWVKGFSQ